MGLVSRNARLLRWYRRHRRPLPWRENPEPYRTWLSEVMLQQTQVTTVVPYFERFVEKFPDVHALARASEQDVLAAWSGLGYYRRARSLHRAAATIVEELDGKFPDNVAGWMKLSGIGRYTAGAIVSIAFGKRVPILDGNVMRVLSRWFVVRSDPRTGETNRELWRLAEEILPKRSVSEFNQALMELGALVCTPKSPGCVACPVRAHCEARALGLVETLPELPPRPRSVRVTMAAALIERQGRYLMYQRSGTEVMKDMWEFPGGECLAGESPRAALARESRAKYGLAIQPDAELARVKHNIMNRRIDLYAFSAELEGPVERLPNARPSKWVHVDDLATLPVSSMVGKVIRAVAQSSTAKPSP